MSDRDDIETLREWLNKPHDTSATSEEWAALDRVETRLARAKRIEDLFDELCKRSAKRLADDEAEFTIEWNLKPEDLPYRDLLP